MLGNAYPMACWIKADEATPGLDEFENQLLALQLEE
jgi:hypothetical protein